MPSLPILSGRDVVKAFAKDGWQMVRQRGSHKVLVKAGHMATLSVPDHRRKALRVASPPSTIDGAAGREMASGHVQTLAE
jgi:predicted RNA binding protein YcfA (HicA-like mRNA interferase family)